MNTGETAVGPGGNEKGLVLGDVVNVAARLQSVAEPGTVVVGDTTRRLTEDAIAYQELGPCCCARRNRCAVGGRYAPRRRGEGGAAPTA